MEQTVSPTVRSTQCSPRSTQRSIQTSTSSTNSFFIGARTLWTALAVLALAFALLVATVATLAGVLVAGAFRGASGGVATPLAIVRISRSGERERTQRERDDKRRRFSEIKRHFSITFLID